MNIIFIDAKYTDLDENNKQPISIALIEMESGDRAYLEFSDFDINLCSDKLKNNVLPLLRRSSGLTIEEGMEFFSAWISKKGETYIVGEDLNDYLTMNNYIKYNKELQHFVWLTQLIQTSLSLRTEEALEFYLNRFKQYKDFYFETHKSSTYHALDDAEATFFAYKNIRKLYVKSTI